MAEWLFSNATYNGETDRLPSTAKPATPLGGHPQAFQALTSVERYPPVVTYVGPPPPQSGSPDSFAQNDITKPYQKPASWA